MTRFSLVTFALPLILFLGTYSLQASDFHVVSLREVTLEYQDYVSPGRDLLLYPETHNEGLNLGVRMDIAKYLYWDNHILTETTSSQYRSVGLTTEIGMQATSYLGVFFQHTSEHLLDRAHAFLPRYPVYDAWGLRLTLYFNPVPRAVLLPRLP